MPMLNELNLRTPATSEEAGRLLAQGPHARILGGGTGLVANMRLGLHGATELVSLERIAGYRELTETADGYRIGAGVSLARLCTDAGLKKRFPAIAEAALTVAGPSHRTAATLGGNLCLDTRCQYYNQNEAWRASNGYCLKYRGEICHVAPQGKKCHAAFSGDVAPVLLALGAEVQIGGTADARRIALAELYRDDGARHLALEPGEFVAAVLVPMPRPGVRMGYRKARARGAIDFPLAGVAVALEMESGKVRELKVALTGTNACPVLVKGCQEFTGKAFDDALADRLGKLVQRQASPQRTTVTASNYRRQVAAALAMRLARELAAQR